MTTRGIHLICPVCRGSLYRNDNTYLCKNGHSYDIAKKGYVNLAMSQRSSKKRHGDDKLMVGARKAFLDKGFYKPLANAVADEILKYGNGVIVDAGCGEGYYTAALQNAFPESDIYGIDISKDALIYAARRDKRLTLAAASAANIPVADGCADVVLSIFAPVFPEEFSRLLKSGGVLIRAVPLEDHLFGLKDAIYEHAYKNPPDDFALDKFTVISRRELKYTITLESRGDIESLFMMTPYYYKTSRSDQERLLKNERLETQVEFGVLTYQKN